jgi:mRNA-degrading endonuclease RelE of RelBE toxin-antitoxin system
MKCNVFVSKTFQKEFYKLQEKLQKLIKTALRELEKDPYKSRPNCDIKQLKETKPIKYRLRVGDYRVIYIIDKKEVKIIDILKRETGYSKLD